MDDVPQSATAVADDAVEIAVPLRTEHAATLRVIVSSLGSDHGLNVDEIDDLKLAVSEIFTLLTDDADRVGASKAHVRFVAHPGEIRVDLHRGVRGDTLALDALATTILSSVVDQHAVNEHGVSLLKRTDRAV